VTDEQWAWVVGYEGKYEVSDYGNIRSWASPNGRPGGLPSEPKSMKSSRNHSGYHVICLRERNGVGKSHRVHCLVLEAFVGPRPEGFQGCHHNDDKENNRLDNLAWKSVGDNSRDRSANGRTAIGTRHGRFKSGKFIGKHRIYQPNKHVN
jgi:hypothetical protein